MLQKSTIAKRYATAILSLSKEFNILDEVNNDFKMLDSLLKQSHDFHNLLSNPIIIGKQKIKIIKKIFDGKINTLVIKLLEVLLRYDRGDLFESIITIFSELYIDEKGILPVKLTVANEMDNNEKELLRKSLEEFTNKKVDFEEIIDDDLIGGFVVDFSAYRLDASVRTALKDYHKVLSKGTF